MADNPLISQITLPSGTTYDIKDAKARTDIAELQQYTDYLGVTSTTLTDGATTNPITINDESVTAVKGNIANYGSKEFIFNGTAWQEFGDLSGLGELAFEDASDLEVSFSGTAAAQTFTGTEATLSHSVTQGTVSASATYTPAGSVSVATSSSETICSGVTPTTTTVSVGDGAGSVSAGSAASFTQGTDTFTATVASENLTLGFTQGTDSFTANTPTAVTLPTFQDQTVVTGVSANEGSVSIPATFSFSGTEATINSSGTTSGVAVAAHTYTPAGSNGTSSVSGSGTVSISS